MAWSFSTILLLTFVIPWDAAARSNSNNQVETNSGPVRGNYVRYSDGIHLNEYLGIPFAKPPIKDLRFRKPQPVEKWTKTLKATKFSLACIQFNEYPFPEKDLPRHGKSEDCLYLNIWVPINTNSEKYMTIFWIHGGDFSFGSSYNPIYDGQTLAVKGNVIVVTTNYRKNAFGFLTSGTKEAPGNVGIYDMVEALKWIKRNIAAFGGDPDKITLAGQGAGAISVGLLCVSPLTKGMFQSVIMESGSPAYLLAENNTANVALSQKLAEALGCATDKRTIYSNPNDVVRCLREKEANDIAKTLFSLYPTSPETFIPSYGDELLPENARKALISGGFTNVPVLIGTNHDEGSYLLTTRYPKVFDFFGFKNPKINKTYGEFLLREMFESFEDPNAVIQHYLGDLEEDDYDRVRKQVYTAIGDYRILCPTLYFAESYSQAGNNVFYYFFLHRPSITPWARWMGVAHFEEVQFVFGVPLKNPVIYDSNEEINLSRAIVKLWSSFAKTGSPSNDDIWPKYTKEEQKYLGLNITKKNSFDDFDASYGQGPHKKNCDFFRGYFGFD